MENNSVCAKLSTRLAKWSEIFACGDVQEDCLAGVRGEVEEALRHLLAARCCSPDAGIAVPEHPRYPDYPTLYSHCLDCVRQVEDMARI